MAVIVAGLAALFLRGRASGKGRERAQRAKQIDAQAEAAKVAIEELDEVEAVRRDLDMEDRQEFDRARADLKVSSGLSPTAKQVIEELKRRRRPRGTE